jgi:hypothetical protein
MSLGALWTVLFLRGMQMEIQAVRLRHVDKVAGTLRTHEIRATATTGNTISYSVKADALKM